MTHDEFVEGCKLFVRSAHEHLKQADDELPPVVLVIHPEDDHENTEEAAISYLPIPPELMEPRIKHRAMQALGQALRIMGIKHVAFACEAWMVTYPPETSLKDLPDIDDPMPSEHPRRHEVVMLLVCTYDGDSAWQAEILRPPDGSRPVLCEWKGQRHDDAPSMGAMAEPLRDAVRL